MGWLRLAAALLAWPVLGSQGQAAARVAIDFAAAEGAPQWYSDALEQLVAREVSRFHRVTLVDAVDTSPCADPACIVRKYADLGVDVVVLGRLSGDALEYQVHETWSHSRAFEGSFAVRGSNVSSSRLQHRITEIVRPIVSSGGLLDKKPVPVAVVAKVKVSRSALVPLALALLTLWPPFLLFLLLGRQRFRAARARCPTWNWSAAVVAALAIVAVVPLPELPVLAPLTSGILWGGLAVALVGVVFPPLHGLSRVRHDALGPVLRAYVAMCGLRAVLVLVLGAPLVTLAGGWPLPLVGLWGVFFVLSLVDNLSAWLDLRLADGLLSPQNPWHATVRKYFMGYVKRSGLLLDRGFLERALFLPAQADAISGVTLYGGGLSRPRVLIAPGLLQLCMGEFPDELEVAERTMNPEELPDGFVVPREDERQSWSKAEKRRRALGRAPPRVRASTPRLLGEPATALGWVVPQPVETAVPLISNTREDYEVVKSLLTEHYARFEKNFDEDEHDDTDPTQKDFLFGALMIAAGGFTRRDNLFDTVTLALHAARARASWPSRQVMRACAWVWARFLEWPSAAVADAYAALNQALHHTFQYLHVARGGDEAVLTARADAPHLVEMSKTLLERFWSSAPEGLDRHLFRPTPRNRALWLAPFFYARLAPGRAGRLKVVAVAVAAVVAVTVVAAAVREAVAYRPTYVDRMAEMQSMAAKAKSGAAK